EAQRARAEFIRLQCQLAAGIERELEREGPITVAQRREIPWYAEEYLRPDWPAELPELLRRSEALETQYRKGWLPAPPDQIEDRKWGRGLLRFDLGVSRLNVSKHLAPLSRLAREGHAGWIHGLELWNPPDTAGDRLARSPLLAQLNSLTVTQSIGRPLFSLV